MSAYVIACNSRTKTEVLFMVDRRKQKKSFWSNGITDVFVYANHGAATTKASSLRHNNPRVLTLTEAQAIATKQAKLRIADENQRVHEVGLAAIEDGWDGHKLAW